MVARQVRAVTFDASTTISSGRRPLRRRRRLRRSVRDTFAEREPAATEATQDRTLCEEELLEREFEDVARADGASAAMDDEAYEVVVGARPVQGSPMLLPAAAVALLVLLVAPIGLTEPTCRAVADLLWLVWWALEAVVGVARGLLLGLESLLHDWLLLARALGCDAIAAACARRGLLCDGRCSFVDFWAEFYAEPTRR